jgi:5-methylcytosine-specific restriction endonuclease McrA
MEWFRFYHGTPEDAKLWMIAEKAHVPRAFVQSLWIYCMDFASQAEDRGSISSLDIEQAAYVVQCEESKTREIIDLFRQRGMVSGERLTAWDRRQPKREREDDSGDRVRAYRERVKENGGAVGGYRRHFKEIYDRDGGACVYCGETSKKALCLDHGVPVCQKGDDDPMNLYLACKKCNSGKSGRTPDQAGYKFIRKESADLFRENENRLRDMRDTKEVTTCHADVTTVTPRTEQNREEQSIAENPAAALPTVRQYRNIPEPDVSREGVHEVYSRMYDRHPYKGKFIEGRMAFENRLENAVNPMAVALDIERSHQIYCDSSPTGYIPDMAKYLTDRLDMQAPKVRPMPRKSLDSYSTMDPETARRIKEGKRLNLDEVADIA